MEEEDSEGSKLKVVLVIGLIVVLSAAVIWFLSKLFDTEIEQPKKTIQEIKVIRPPPPPPEIEEEPPPEPEVEEEVDIPEPEEIPDLPDMEPPPGEQLGLDAEGGAGGDAFGLLGKKGGRGLIGSGDGDRNLWYANNVVKAALLDKLYEVDGMLALKYRIRLNIWVQQNGEITRYKLLESTGEPTIDKKINLALAGMKKLNTLPPPNMPQPVRLAIEAR